MIKKLLLASALSCGVLLAVSPAKANPVNLVTNGSFEDGLNAWTQGGTDTGNPTFPPVIINYNSATPYPTGAFGEAVPANNAATNSPDAVGDHAAYFVSDFAKSQSLSQSIVLAAGTY